MEILHVITLYVYCVIFNVSRFVMAEQEKNLLAFATHREHVYLPRFRQLLQCSLQFQHGRQFNQNPMTGFAEQCVFVHRHFGCAVGQCNHPLPVIVPSRRIEVEDVHFGQGGQQLFHSALPDLDVADSHCVGVVLEYLT